MNGQIKITLRSDLCAASGDGFSLAIDTDVCTDRFGLPYIPSRRLKGVMREAANYISCENITGIFGESGNDTSGSLAISNAVLEQNDSLITELIANPVLPEKVTSLFTSVKASTAIENDTAKEESLRFMRVVNKYSPLNDKSELVFIADIECEEKFEEDLNRICKAVRNIGFKRSRGFGAIKCEFSKTDKTGFNPEPFIFSDDDNYRINYTIKLDSPLMMTGTSGSETSDFINGSAVLGAFAGKYLKKHNPDAQFEELLLKGNVLFSNLYISANGVVGAPAPAVLGKAKGRSEIEFVEQKKDAPMIKSFKKGYIAAGKELKISTETIYHNGGFIDKDKKDKTLYMQTVLSEGQLFSGYIEGSGNYIKELYPLFSGCFRFGKSRTAQYAQCSVVSCKVEKPENKTIRSSEKMFAVFVSDVLLSDEQTAGYTTDFSKLKEVIEKISENIKVEENKTSLKYRTINGYVSVGRYKKTHIRAFAAGSTVCLDVKACEDLPQDLYIGEKQQEGFGHIVFCTKEGLFELGRQFEPISIDIKRSEDLTSLLSRNDDIEEMRMSAINFAEHNKSELTSLNPAFIGRVTLMINQAKDFSDLIARIESIKNDSKRSGTQRLIENARNIYEKFDEYWREYLKTVFTLAKYYIKETEGAE